MSRPYDSFYGLCRYTWLNKNLLLILILFIIVFILHRKANFLIIELTVSFADNIKVFLGQLKRFNESVIDPKCLLKVEATSCCFDNNLSFSSNIIFSCILLFLFEKYSLHAFQNDLELQSTLRFSKYCNLAYSGLHQVLLLLKLNNVTWIFWLVGLFVRHDLVIICLQRFLLKWVFWLSRKFFVFLGASLSEM